MKVFMRHWSRAFFSVGIIALAAVVCATSATSGKNAAPKPDARDNLRQVGLALRDYVQDYDEIFPPMQDAATIRELLSPYVKSDLVFINPTTKQPFLPNPWLSRRPVNVVYAESYRKRQAIVAFYEASPKADGSRYVLALPIPTALSREGLPIWFDKSWDQTVSWVGGEGTEYKVNNISRRDRPKVKKASNIP